MAQIGWVAWVSSEGDFHVGRQIMQEGDSRNLAICTGQMKGEPRRSSSRSLLGWAALESRQG